MTPTSAKIGVHKPPCCWEPERPKFVTQKRIHRIHLIFAASYMHERLVEENLLPPKPDWLTDPQTVAVG